MLSLPEALHALYERYNRKGVRWTISTFTHYGAEPEFEVEVFSGNQLLVAGTSCLHELEEDEEGSALLAPPVKDWNAIHDWLLALAIRKALRSNTL